MTLATAQPIGDAPPKQQPDEESLGAAWVRLEDLAHLPLRSNEVLRVLRDQPGSAAPSALGDRPEGSSLLAR